MFEKILSLFQNDTPKKLDPSDEKLALGALMVRLAKADKSYLFEEIAQIDRLLSVKHDIDPIAAAKLRADCEALERQMPSTPTLIEVLKEATSLEAREALTLAFWRVALADKVTQKEEIAMMESVEIQLGIDPARSAALLHQARLMEGS